jgi:hypothetical protein
MSEKLRRAAQMMREAAKMVEEHIDEGIGQVSDPPPESPPMDFSGPPCDQCGGITQRAGRCWVCQNCGESSGGCE